MTDGTFELSRRKALLGIGTVGVASAGAGMGTSAYFTDEENFENNTLQAGELNLYATFDGGVDQGGADTGTTINSSATADGNVVTGAYQIADLKPGDSGWFSVQPCVEGNPAYVYVGGALTEDAENSVTEPEEDVDNNVMGGSFSTGDGELAESIEITELNGIAGTSAGDLDADGDGTTTLRELLNAISDGVLVGNVSAGNCAGSVEVKWKVPTSVGNEIQSDSVGFDLAVAAVQERHYDEANETNPLNSSA